MDFDIVDNKRYSPSTDNTFVFYLKRVNMLFYITIYLHGRTF